jgi:hypothetical protein
MMMTMMVMMMVVVVVVVMMMMMMMMVTTMEQKGKGGGTARTCMHIGSQVIMGTMMTPPPTPTMLPKTPATTPVLTLSIATSVFVPFTSCGWGSSDICLAACPLAITSLVPANPGAFPRLVDIDIRSFAALKFPTQIPRLTISALAGPIARRTADDAANVSMFGGGVWDPKSRKEKGPPQRPQWH